MIDAQFSNTLTLGSTIVLIVVALLGVFILFYGAKWRAAYQLAFMNEQGYKEMAERLDREVASLKDEILRLRARLAELEALPDLAVLHAILTSHDKTTTEAMKQHDTHAEARTDRIIKAIKEAK